MKEDKYRQTNKAGAAKSRPEWKAPRETNRMGQRPGAADPFLISWAQLFLWGGAGRPTKCFNSKVQLADVTSTAEDVLCDLQELSSASPCS